MDIGTVVAIASMGIAIMALVAAIAQVSIQQSIEERRKGKTDKLALGEWAISWPQTKSFIFVTLSGVGIPSPFGDPRVIAVPFITIGALEDCLRREAAGEKRGSIERRMKSRLVESATQSLATGAGRFTGRMYAVRDTTRKRAEACWSDSMDMCGITRRYWPLLTGANALACDGAIRPANAVTNLHSLCGFARAMGLRFVEIHGTRITMTNGGASIYLDQYAGVDRPTRLAHFSGSPNGRYQIIEEMSQQTAESVYADAVWSDGCVPSSQRLEPEAKGDALKDPSKRYVSWPLKVDPPSLDPSDGSEMERFESWATDFFTEQRARLQTLKTGEVLYTQLIESSESAIISCIRTYPKTELTHEQIVACDNALLWCVRHWWLDPYQLTQDAEKPPTCPRLPQASTSEIGAEFVTGRMQAVRWCLSAGKYQSVPIDDTAWQRCWDYAHRVTAVALPVAALSYGDHTVLLKLLQGWKLHTFWRDFGGLENSTRSNPNRKTAALCQILLLSMAQLALALDSSSMGSSEINKAMEIELG